MLSHSHLAGSIINHTLDGDHKTRYCEELPLESSIQTFGHFLSLSQFFLAPCLQHGQQVVPRLSKIERDRIHRQHTSQHFIVCFEFLQLLDFCVNNIFRRV